MHGAMGGGTNGAGHVNMGLPYKAYNAEQVSAMQVMVRAPSRSLGRWSSLRCEPDTLSWFLEYRDDASPLHN